MAIETRLSTKQYERLALQEPDQDWELWDGHLRGKPAVTAAHNWLGSNLGYLLMSQLDWGEYQVRIDSGRVHRPGATYFIPDVFVLPTASAAAFLLHDDLLEVYPDPLPLVVEIWSPSTGDYDVWQKLRIYRERGDHEIWLVHPYDRTVLVWRREPNGSYAESIQRRGILAPVALPGVVIDLDLLFTA